MIRGPETSLALLALALGAWSPVFADDYERWRVPVLAPGLTESQRAKALVAGARTRAALGDDAGAERGFKAALEALPGDAEASYRLASVLRDRPEEALGYALAAAKAARPVVLRAQAERLAGEILMDLGDDAGASASLERALTLDGDDLYALQDLARLQRTRPKDAAAHARRACTAAERAPRWLRPAALRQCARVWLELDDYGAAMSSLKRALALDPEDVNTLETMVEIRHRLGQIVLREDAPAAAPPPEVLASDPDGLVALRVRLELILAQKRTAETAALAERFASAIEDAPMWQQADARHFLVELWLTLGDEPNASRSLRPALILDHGSVKTLSLYARIDSRKRPDAAHRRKKQGSPLPSDAFISIARSYAELGDAAAAAKYLQRAVSQAPEDMQTLQDAIAIKLAQGLPSEALGYAELLTRAATGAPPSERAPAYRQKARLQIELKDEEGAARSLAAALEAAPSDAENLRRLVHFELGRGRVKPALAYADRLLAASERLSPAQLAEACRLKAQLQLELKDESGADASLRRALAAVPGDADALRRLVELRLAQGRPAEALAFSPVLLKSVASAPAAERAAAQRLRARTALALKDEGGAERGFQAALEAAPADAQTLRALVEFELGRARLKEALAYAERLVKAVAGSAAPLRAAALLQRAAVELALGDADAAERSLGRTLGTVPGDAEALRRLTRLELGRGRLDAALARCAALAKAVAGEPATERAAVLRMRAQIELGLKDAAGAEKSLLQALALRPEDADALRMLGQLTLDAGRVSEARSYCDREIAAVAAGAPGERTAAFLRKARILLGLGDPAGAAANAERALALVAGDAASLELLLQVALDRGEPARALALSERLLKAVERGSPHARAAAQLRRARAQRELKDAAGAEASLLRALELAPGDAETLRWIVEARLDAGLPAQAALFSERLLTAVAGAPPAARAAALRQRARVELELKNEPAAEAALVRALAAHTDDAAALSALADLALARGHLAEAADYSDRVLKDAEGGAPTELAAAYRQRARVRVELKDYAGAAASLKRALDLVAEDAAALHQFAQVELDRRRPDAALAYSDRLLKARVKAPAAERAVAFRQRAQIQLELSDEAGARKSLRSALAAVPADAATLRRLAELDLERGRPEEALKNARRLIATGADHLLNARILLALRREPAALAALDRALTAEPGNLEALWLLVELGRGRGRDALARVDAGRSAGAASAPWLVLRGQALASLGDASGAGRDFAEAVAADPRGACFAPIFQAHREGIDPLYFDRCVEKFPAEAALYADRGIARYRHGRADEAVADFRKAAELAPKFLEARLSLASALAAQNKVDEALAEADLAAGLATDRGAPIYARIAELRGVLHARAKTRRATP